MNWLYGILIYIAGGMFGITVMSLMFAAKEADRHIEDINKNDKGG